MPFFDNLIPPFTDAAWTKHANAQASADGKTLTLNASGQWQASTVTIPVTPGSRLNLTTAQAASAGYSYVSVRRPPYTNLDMIVEVNNTIPAATVTVPFGVTSLMLYVGSSAAGTFTFFNLTLQRVAPTFNPANVPLSPFRNLIPLFSDSAWSRHVNTTVSPDGKTLTLNANASDQWSNTPLLGIAVIPGVTYRLNASMVGSGGVVRVWWRMADGNPVTVNSYMQVTPSAGTVDAVAPARAVYAQAYVGNPSAGAGTCTFSNLSLTPVQPTFDPAKVVELTKELVVNGDFSQGATGWTFAGSGTGYDAADRHGYVSMNGNGFYNASPIPVTPLTTYRLVLKYHKELVGDTISVQLRDGAFSGTVLSTTTASAALTEYTVEFVTPANCTQITVIPFKGNAGTDGKKVWFDNISLKRKLP